MAVESQSRRLMQQAGALVDGQAIDAGDQAAYHAVLVELAQLVAEAPELLAVLSWAS